MIIIANGTNIGNVNSSRTSYTPSVTATIMSSRITSTNNQPLTTMDTVLLTSETSNSAINMISTMAMSDTAMTTLPPKTMTKFNNRTTQSSSGQATSGNLAPLTTISHGNTTNMIRSTSMPLNLSSTVTDSSGSNATTKQQPASTIKITSLRLSNTSTSKANTLLFTAIESSNTAADMISTIVIASTRPLNTGATLGTTKTMAVINIPTVPTTQSVSVLTTPEPLSPLMTPDSSNSPSNPESFFEINKWIFIPVFIVVGIVTILLVPGAVCGYFKISKPIYETLTT